MIFRSELGGHAKRVSATRIAVAVDLVTGNGTGEIASATMRTSGPLRVVFLSRISAKKNLDYAIRVLSEVSCPVEFTVFGMIDDDAHWTECLKHIESLPEHIGVRYAGVVRHKDVPALLSLQDLFFLPTRGENYGHAVFEALAAGLPVLLSDQTPWRGLREKGIGWDLPLGSPGGFVAVIEEQARMSPAEMLAQRARAQEYALQVADDGVAVSQSRSVFLELISQHAASRRAQSASAGALEETSGRAGGVGGGVGGEVGLVFSEGGVILWGWIRLSSGGRR